MAAAVIAEGDCPGKFIFIYALIDPTTGERRYVGKTNDIPQRLRAHESEARYSRSRKSNWIRGLQKQGLRPEAVCLETVQPGGDWIEAEIRWIAKGRSERWGLLNVTDGGDDIPAAAHSPEARKKGAAARKISKRWLAGIAAGHAKRRGVKLSEAHKQKISLGNKGKKLSPEHIERLRAANTGLVYAPERLARMSDAQKGKIHTAESNEKRRQTMLLKSASQAERQKNNWTDPEYRTRVQANMAGHATSSAARAKLAATSKASWSDPVIREKRTSSIRAKMATPEWREQRSKIAKQLWSDPEFRARMKAARKKK